MLAFGCAVCLGVAAGCGSGAPSGFPDVRDVQVESDISSMVSAWAQAQGAGDEVALEALYDPAYGFDGRTAADMARVRLLPDTPETRVDSIQYRFIPADAATGRSWGQQSGSERVVRVRVNAAGVVSAEAISPYVTEGASEESGHEHSHRAVLGRAAGRHEEATEAEHAHIEGTVTARATWDVEWTLRNGPDRPLIVRQRIVRGELRLGGGLSAPLLSEVHLHPDEPHGGDVVEVDGHYAALPPGGAIAVRIGHHEAQATAEAGVFHADLHAPQEPGEYVAQVRAFGGSLASRTAAVSFVEREVTVQ
jgi:hypothetical protein